MVEVNLPELEDFAYYFKKDRIVLPLWTDDILNIFNNLETDILKSIKKVIYQDNVYKLYLREGGGVNLGRNEKLEEKFAILKSILDNNQEAEIDYVNLQVTKHPVIKLK
jgi:cell division protein FtsQ